MKIKNLTGEIVYLSFHVTRSRLTVQTVAENTFKVIAGRVVGGKIITWVPDLPKIENGECHLCGSDWKIPMRQGRFPLCGDCCRHREYLKRRITRLREEKRSFEDRLAEIKFDLNEAKEDLERYRK